MKNNLTNGILLAVVAVGIYIGTQLGSGFGLGRGAGPGGGEVKPKPESVAGKGDEDAPPGQAEPETHRKTSRNQTVSAPEMVTVIIVGKDYYQCAKDEIEDGEVFQDLPTTPISLDDLVEAVAQAKGNSLQIRLRVYREKSAETGAWSDLANALKEAGIKSQEVQIVKSFLIK